MPPRRQARDANSAIINMPNDNPFEPTQVPANLVAGATPGTHVNQHYADDPGAEQYESPEDELAAVMAGLGDAGEEGSISIFKFAPGSKKREWVDKRAVSEFNHLGLPWMAKVFGAGDYELFIYGADKLLAARRKITISDAAAKLHAESAPAAPGTNGDLAAAMLAGFQELGKLIVAQSQRPADDAEEKVLNKMLRYKELFGGGPAQQPAQPANQFNQMRAAIDFVKELQPRPEGAESNFADAAMKFMEKFGGPILERIQTAQQQPAQIAATPGQVVALPAQPGVMNGPVNQPQQMPRDNPAMFENLLAQRAKNFMGLLIDSAEQDADPYTYANMILDKVPEAMVRDWLSKPDLVAELAKIDPRVASHPVWFNKLKDELERALSDDPETNAQES